MPNRLTPHIAPYRNQLASQGFALLHESHLGWQSRADVQVLFEDLEPDLPAVHPNRRRARDVFHYQRHGQGPPLLSEAASVLLCGKGQNPEPRNHKRLLLLGMPAMADLARAFLDLIPLQDRRPRGRISFDLFRSFDLVVKSRHRDHEPFVALHCLQKIGLGAHTELSLDDRGERIRFRKSLDPGEILIFKDELYFHYTSPLRASLGEAQRDVILVMIA